MKICRYCDTQAPDADTSCDYCGSKEFDFVCENCQTRFHSGFCPDCGAQAGEKPRICPNCGARSMSVFCPDCGRSLIPLTREPAAFAQQVADVSSRSNVGLVILTVFMPYIGAWILLLNDRYSRNLKIFALLYSAFASAMLFLQRSWVAGLVCFTPIAGYGIKVGLDRVRRVTRN